MQYCYIIYSRSVNRYYIGETDNIERRLMEHNTGIFEKSYTKQASDWQLYLIIECIDRSEARKLESFIKKMKSRKFIESLKENPEKANHILICKFWGS